MVAPVGEAKPRLRPYEEANCWVLLSTVRGIVPSVRDLARETVDGDKLPAAGETWEGYRGYAGRSISLGMHDVPNEFLFIGND